MSGFYCCAKSMVHVSQFSQFSTESEQFKVVYSLAKILINVEFC